MKLRMLIVLILTLHGVAGAMPFDFPQKFRLKNGMMLVVQQDTSLPLVGMALVVHGGSIHEGADEKGCAALTAEIWDSMEGDATLGKLHAQLTSRGISFDAYSDRLFQHAWLSVAKDSAPQALEYLAGLLAVRKADPQHLERARAVVLRELSTFDQYPRESGVLRDSLVSKLYGTCSLAHCPKGDPDQVRALDAHKLEGFLSKVLAPSRAVLVVVGDVVPEDVLVQVQQLVPGEAAEFSLEGLTPTLGELPDAVDETHHDGLETAIGELGFRIPPVTEPDYVALDLLRRFLAEGTPSLLHGRLVEREGQLKSISSQISLMPFENFLSFELVSTGEDLRQAGKTVLEECLRISRRGIDPEALERVRQGAKVHRALQRQMRDERALKLAIAEQVGDMDLEVDYNDRIDAVTVDDLRRVAGAYLTPDRAVMTVFTPKEGKEMVEEGTVTIPIRDGVRLAFKRDASTDVVGISIYLPAGMSEDPAGLQGLGSLLEYYLTQTSPQDTSALEWRHLLERNGVTIQPTGAGFDGLVLSLNATVYNFPELLKGLHSLVTSPRFEATAFQRIRKEFVEGWKSFAREPTAVGKYTGWELLYPGSPDVHPLESLLAGMEKASLDDLRRHHQWVLARPGLVIAVTGNLALEKVEADVREAFGLPPGSTARSGETTSPITPDPVPDAHATASPVAGPDHEVHPFTPLTGHDVKVFPATQQFDTVWVLFKLRPAAHGDTAPLTVGFTLLGIGADALIPARIRALDPSYETIWNSLHFPTFGGMMSFGYRVAPGKGKEVVKDLQAFLPTISQAPLSPGLISETRDQILTRLLRLFQNKVTHSTRLAMTAGAVNVANFFEILQQEYPKVDEAAIRRVSKEHLSSALIVLYEAKPSN